MRDGSTLFSGGRLSSISKVSSWLESYMKMPKHMILLLLQVKFSVSKNVLVFFFPFYQCADEEMELISELYVCLNSLCRDRRRRHPAAVWEDVFWILPGVWIRHHLTCFRIECSRVLAGKKKKKKKMSGNLRKDGMIWWMLLLWDLWVLCE